MRRWAVTVFKWFFPYRSAERSIAAYEAASGHPKSAQESIEFEAVGWLVGSNRNPDTALRAFKEEGGRQFNDLDDEEYEGIRGWLTHWQKELHPHSFAAS